MTNDDGRKPEGAPERSPKALMGAPSGPPRYSSNRTSPACAPPLGGADEETGGSKSGRQLGKLG